MPVALTPVEFTAAVVVESSDGDVVVGAPGSVVVGAPGAVDVVGPGDVVVVEPTGVVVVVGPGCVGGELSVVDGDGATVVGVVLADVSTPQTTRAMFTVPVPRTGNRLNESPVTVRVPSLLVVCWFSVRVPIPGTEMPVLAAGDTCSAPTPVPLAPIRVTPPTAPEESAEHEAVTSSA
jgi:hypothetical protein